MTTQPATDRAFVNADLDNVLTDAQMCGLIAQYGERVERAGDTLVRLQAKQYVEDEIARQRMALRARALQP